MIPQLPDFIPGTLEDMNKHNKVADGHHVTERQKGQVRINMCNDNGDTFITNFHKVLWHQIYATG